MTDTHIPAGAMKFGGTNYQTWKFQIGTYLTAIGLLDVVNGTRTAPTDLTTADGKSWVKDNARAMHIMLSTVTPDQVQNFVVCSDAAEMWKQLATVYEQKSESNKLSLLQNFHRSNCMQSSESVLTYIMKIRNDARKLKDIGEPQWDLSLVAKIIDGLPSKFDAFVSAWNNLETKEQTLTRLQERLLAEKKRIGAKETEVTAYVAEKSSKRKGPALGSAQARQIKRKDKSEIQCYRCKEFGHYKRECPAKKKGRESNPNGGKLIESEFRAFVVTTAEGDVHVNTAICRGGEVILGCCLTDMWFSHSGASMHITYRREWFDDLEPRSGDFVRLGDDVEHEIEGIGRVRIERLTSDGWQKDH